jgi:hypothetical protein
MNSRAGFQPLVLVGGSCIGESRLEQLRADIEFHSNNVRKHDREADASRKAAARCRAELQALIDRE